MGELTAQLDEIDRRFQSRKDFDCQTEGVLSSQIKTETVVSPLGDEPVGEEDILDEKVRRALVGGLHHVIMPSLALMGRTERARGGCPRRSLVWGGR